MSIAAQELHPKSTLSCCPKIINSLKKTSWQGSVWLTGIQLVESVGQHWCLEVKVGLPDNQLGGRHRIPAANGLLSLLEKTQKQYQTSLPITKDLKTLGVKMVTNSDA